MHKEGDVKEYIEKFRLPKGRGIGGGVISGEGDGNEKADLGLQKMYEDGV